ncbi:MAG: hypothetical protein ACRD19_07250, partial [Terriglobia bacterium]
KPESPTEPLDSTGTAAPARWRICGKTTECGEYPSDSGTHTISCVIRYATKEIIPKEVRIEVKHYKLLLLAIGQLGPIYIGPKRKRKWIRNKCPALIFPLFMIAASSLWAQGPPFQTDDPVPVDLHHYEFYIFGSADGTPAEMDSTGPAFEFNWGAIPRVQLHIIAPWGTINPSNNPIYAPGGIGPSAFGFMDMELGAKIAFIKESKYIPQIGTFTMFEMPTGSYSKGLGVGHVWYKVPLWLQKNIGHWLLDGGGGETVVPQTGYRNFPYGGFLLKYTFGERLELGGEVFSHGREGYATPQTEDSTMIDIGGYYHFKHHQGEQFLFCYGHSVAGQTEQYAYVGMYWTWGKDKKKRDSSNTWLPGPMNAPGFRPMNGTGLQ